MNYLKKSFNREKPNMPIIIIFLAVLSLITILLATGLGPVSVEPGNPVKPDSGYWKQCFTYMGTAGSEYCAGIKTSESLSWHGSGSIFGSVWCHHAGIGTE